MNLSVYHGTSAKHKITVRDPDGALVDLSTVQLEFRAKLRTEDPDPPVIDKSTPGGIQISNQGTHLGEATLFFVPNDTAGLPNDRTTMLRYQVNLIDGSDVFEAQSGILSVLASV